MTLEAHYTNGGKRRSATLSFATTKDGRRTFVGVIYEVTGKRHARQLAAEVGATPWNF